MASHRYVEVPPHFTGKITFQAFRDVVYKRAAEFNAIRARERAELEAGGQRTVRYASIFVGDVLKDLRAALGQEGIDPESFIISFSDADDLAREFARHIKTDRKLELTL